MVDQNTLLKWNHQQSTFHHVISGLKYKEFFSDIILACNGKFYPLHRCILAISSEYFNELFKNVDCSNSLIILTDIECSDLEILLNYMYCGEVNIQQNHVTSLLRTAKFLKIKGLFEHDIKGQARSMDTDHKISCTSSMENPENSKVKIKCLSDESENAFDVEDLPETDYPDELQSDSDVDDPLDMLDLNVSESIESRGMQNNSVPPSMTDKGIFTGNVSNTLADTQGRQSKRTKNYHSNRPCKLKKEPGAPLHCLSTKTSSHNSDKVISTKSVSDTSTHTQGPPSKRKKACTGLAADASSVSCNEDGCLEKFKLVKSLRKHLVDCHGGYHPQVKKVFASENEYKAWKEQYESENNVTYSLYDQNNRNGVKKYLRCNLSKSNRNFKVTSKLDGHCTSTLTVRLEDNHIAVEHFPSHYNH